MPSTTTAAEAPPLLDILRENVRVRLFHRNMSQAALARALDVAPTWVSRRLAGEVAATLTDLERLAGALELTVVELITPGGAE